MQVGRTQGALVAMMKVLDARHTGGARGSCAPYATIDTQRLRLWRTTRRLPHRPPRSREGA